jgi:Flp pilus assembly pilin Flp
MDREIDRLARDMHGATAIEYRRIVALLVIVIIAGLSALGSATEGGWSNMAEKIGKASQYKY